MRKAIIRNPFIRLFCFLAFSSPFKMLTYSLAFEIWKITRKINTRIAIEKKSFMILNFPQYCLTAGVKVLLNYCIIFPNPPFISELNLNVLNPKTSLHMMYNTFLHERMMYWSHRHPGSKPPDSPHNNSYKTQRNSELVPT